MPNPSRPESPLAFVRSVPEKDAPPSHEESLSIAALLGAGTLDVGLAALLWLLVEGRVPVIVAAAPRLAGKTTLLTALMAFLPPTAAVRELAGFAEDFGWLPDAARLGWRPDGTARPRGTDATGPDAARGEPLLAPSSGYLVANELSPHLPWYTWGEQARIAVRALSLGYGLGATIHADSLQEVFDELRGPDVRLTDDELSHLGAVLILRAFRGADGAIVRRVAAAHYVRPVSRDAGGHVQRLPPAVLATWDSSADVFEDFSWGLTGQLAARVGRSPGDFDAERDRRRDMLTTLVAAGITAYADVHTAIQGYRLAGTGHRH